MSDSLRPSKANVASVLGIVLPMLGLAGGLVKAYSELATQQETRRIFDQQHSADIMDLRAEVKELKNDKETARELSALRAQVAALTATVESLRDDVKGKRGNR